MISQENSSQNLIKNGEKLLDSTLSQLNDFTSYLKENKNNYENSFKEIIKKYIHNLPDILHLHNGLQNISSTIENVEETLSHFQKNLKSISGEMLEIQSKCTQINKDLQDRQIIKRRLTTAIDKLVISERMISVITTTLVTDQEFIEQLHELQYKLTVMEDIRKLNTAASEETYQLILNLKQACLRRLNEYILNNISLFSRPLADCYEVKRTLSANGYLMKFIKETDSFIYETILKEYQNIMKKNYIFHLKTYNKKILELLKTDDTPNNTDLIGTIPSPKIKFFNNSGSHSNKEQYYTLGNRAIIISSDIESDIIVPSAHVNTKFSIENIIRSLHYLLINCCSSEYYFVSDFFCLSDNSAVSAIVFLFSQSIQLYIESSEEIIDRNYDCIGLLLCASLFNRYSHLTKERSLPILKDYFLHMSQYTWNRFTSVVDAHIQSLRKISMPTPSLCDECHIITKRVSSIFSLFYSVIADFTTSQLLLIFSTFIQEWETFLLIQASQFEIRGHQLIYQIVNYNVVLNLLSAQAPISIVASQYNFPYIYKESYDACQTILDHLRQKYDDLITQTCTEELLLYFGSLITFVKNKKFMVDKQSCEVEIKKIAKSFAYEWKRSMSIINVNIKQAFGASFLDREIVGICFSILIDYYSQFKTYITSNCKPVAIDLDAKGLIVDAQQIMVEAKNYK